MTTCRAPRFAWMMRPIPLAVLLLGAAAFVSAAEIAPPLTGRLPTPWSEDAAAGRGWTEYPRPQLVRERWSNLNGLWDYAITPLTTPVPLARLDGKIRVPYAVESTLSGVGRSLSPTQRLWYRRSFDLAS